MAGAIEIKDHTSDVRLALNAQGAMFVDTITPLNVTGTVTATPTGTQAVSGTVTTVPSGTQNVAVTSPVTFPVTGTVTTVPSGTQTVAGTVTTVPSGTTAVSGTVTTVPSGTQTVTGTVGAYETANPAITGGYVYNLSYLAGVAAANNYISVFNPLLSGKTFVLSTVTVSSGAPGATAGLEPMRVLRTTTATLGTLVVNATDVCKFRSSSPASAAEIRIGGPTCTLGPLIWSAPPVTDNQIDPTTTNTFIFPTTLGEFALAPGEGVVLRTEVADTDQRWNLTIAWGER